MTQILHLILFFLDHIRRCPVNEAWVVDFSLSPFDFGLLANDLLVETGDLSILVDQATHGYQKLHIANELSR